ncbi:MAG TPA: M3 family oligoendopeptidase [Chitinophagaceae bacterium]|nr:M3 family oligoendopeptidase [Chitinophagaceae bacterium]
MNYTANIHTPERHFLPKDFIITDWKNLESYFKDLLQREISSEEDLEKWLEDASELEAVISEDANWRQIRMTCDTENKELEQAFTFFVMEIQPHIQSYADKLNKKLVENPYAKKLDHDTYFTYLRNIKKNIELFREENIPLNSELSVLAQHYGVISGKMTIRIDEKEYTLQQAAKFLENPDRNLREEVYKKINDRRLEDKDELNKLFTTLVQKRNQLGLNAGFDNYRDFRFKELGRFDYTKEDCFQFHESVRQHILPLVNEIYQKKKKKLNIEVLKPWDIEASPEGIKPLSPFKTGAELLQKTLSCLDEIDPFFADCLRQMEKMHRLDLESRKGKAPGGYNCPLPESGAPFIFMNAAGQMADITTIIHEGGHAVHSFLTHDLRLNGFKEYPMEIAEVASMSMELFSMDRWESFFENKDELNRAKEYQLERVITIFPWIAIIDKFQHWVYENPSHTEEQRASAWKGILNEFSSSVIDFTGLDEYRQYSWQRQLHLYEVPFYYIEYGIAQLGAIGLWMQFKKDKQTALNNYIKALRLGGTKTLPALFEAAGLKFDFSTAYVSELMSFVHEEMMKLEN